MTMMTRRVVMGFAAAALIPMRAWAALDDGERQALTSVEQYLNGITTLEARFAQTAQDGGRASGKLYIERPGRMRMDYDPPSKILLVATDWRLVFYDGSVKQVTVIPISSTPLQLLLKPGVELENEVNVTGVRRENGEILVTVVRKDEPDQGSATLVFGEQPVALKRWSVVDPQGLTTQIALTDVQTGMALDPELFHWKDPKIFGFPKD